jgi:DNA-directed RNA polymerase subunit RPC12/RpoP
MIYRCKNCGGVIEYSVEKDRMVCDYCKSEFRVEELTQSSDSTDSQSDVIHMRYKGEELQQDEPNFIKMQIVRCTACGAELAVNGVEASTFCAYCGQASVIQDRVDSVLKPNYIIPFKVTKDEAEKIIRKTLKKGFFVPKAIKNFEAEKMRGIYVPFWLFDIRYKDFQYWEYTVKNKETNNQYMDRYEYIEAEAFFKRLTLDASYKLNDDSSVRLEPYDMSQLTKFDTAYLSGYYADRFDMRVNYVQKNAISRACEYFIEMVRKRKKQKNGYIIKNWPIHRITKTDYALLPVWFLTFTYDDEPLTIMVNGQTGKMVGAVPAVKHKVYLFYLFAVLSLFTLLMAGLTELTKLLFIEYFIAETAVLPYLLGIMIIPLILVLLAKNKYDELKRSISLTTELKTNRFMKERQDRYK